MTKADPRRREGIRKPTAAKLVADGITTKSELRTALQEVAPPARHICSSAQAAVLAALDLPTIGAPPVLQYSRQPETDQELQYRCDRQPGSLVLQLRKTPHGYRAEWSTDTGNRSAESTTTRAKAPKTRLLDDTSSPGIGLPRGHSVEIIVRRAGEYA